MFILKIEHCECGEWKPYWESEYGISKEEIAETLPVLLKPSMFGVENYRIVIERI